MIKRFTYFLLLAGSVLACQTDTPVTPDLVIPDYTYTGSSAHARLGNPSAATTNSDSVNNILLEKEQYVLSYNRSTGRPNWVSWHLQASDLGEAERKDDFRLDATLPAGWYQVKPTDYTSADGFDRGHLCPSADRTKTQADNSATFLMTNIIPQAPKLNRGPWEELESYCRELIKEGNELYVIAGGYGTGATGSQGNKTVLATGKVAAPAQCWKVIVALPEGDNDLSRITGQTTVIAVDMLNSQTVREGWEDYIVSVEELERSTRYRFLTTLPTAVQASLKSKKYTLTTIVTPPAAVTTTAPGSATTTSPIAVTTTPPSTVTTTTPTTSTVTAPVTVTTTTPVAVTTTPPVTVTVTSPTTVTTSPTNPGTVTPPSTATTTPPSTGTPTTPGSGSTTTPSSGDPACGMYNGKQLYRGPKGGCYYINGNGNKTYVDRDYCNC